MAAEKDQSGWLPTPPSPRPARREAAIETALRRFDGGEDAAAPAREGARRSWASTHRPQLAMAFSAMLLVVVGVPAALIGLRNAPTTSEKAPPPTIVGRGTTPASPAKRVAPNAQLNLRLVLALFGLVISVVFGVLVALAGYPVPAVILFVLAAVAVVDLVVIQRRRIARHREEAPGGRHSLFE